MNTRETHSSQDLAANTLFDGLTEKTAPAAAQPLLAQAREVFGFVPNLAVAMAAVPAARGCSRSRQCHVPAATLRSRSRAD